MSDPNDLRERVANLPCPFCGSDAALEHFVTADGEGYFVECSGCSANCGVTDSEKTAKQEWNRRARSSLTQLLRDEFMAGAKFNAGRLGLAPFVIAHIQAEAARRNP
jgi:Lar family restriction alleviation protein